MLLELITPLPVQTLFQRKLGFQGTHTDLLSHVFGCYSLETLTYRRTLFGTKRMGSVFAFVIHHVCNKETTPTGLLDN